MQGFTWNQSVYHCPDDAADETIDVEMLFDESAYLILAQRYKELSAEPSVSNWRLPSFHKVA